jgi:hypothetical protein
MAFGPLSGNFAQSMENIMTQVTIDFGAATYATAKVGGKTYPVTLDKIPASSLRKIFEYGLQRVINDKTGGKTDEQKATISNATIDRIYNGTLSVRVKKEAADPLLPFIRQLVKDMFTPEQEKAYKGYDADGRNDFIDEIYESFDDEYSAKIEAWAIDAKAEADVAAQRKAEQAAERKAFAAKMAAGISVKGM